MNTVVRHIEFLLSQHNCVIIPQLGAILAHRTPARLLGDGTILPPCRTYTFNASLKQSDGMLEDSLRRAEKSSYDLAARTIEDAVMQMRRTLEANGRLSLGDAGILTYDRQTGALGYEAPGADLLTPLASWLPVMAPPVVEESAERASAKIPEIPVDQPRILRIDFRRISKSVAVVAAAVAVAIVASTPIVPDDATANITKADASLPAVTAPAKAFVPAIFTPRILLETTADSTELRVDTAARYAYQRQHELCGAPQRDVKEPKAPSIRFNENDAFCVVVASLSTEAEAQEWITNFTKRYGGQYGVLNSGGRYRVYAATANSAAAANNMVGYGRLSHFKGAWVCRL